MRKLKTSILTTGLAVLVLSGALQAADRESMIAMGKEVYLNKSKGNCVSCHQIDDADATQAGNQGPPIVAMKQRFPDKAVLRAQVWDATVNNPITIMPPLGKHWILSEEEIDAVVEYVYQY